MKSIAPPNLNDINQVLNYGADAQAQVAEFSEIALENLKAKDLGEVSGKISELIVRLKEPEEKPPMLGIFRKPAALAENLKNRYKKACETVDKIAVSLQGQRDLLMKDIEMLEMLYGMNREQYETLTEYIRLGQTELERFRREILAPLERAAEENETPEGAQAVRDAAEKAERFEKKLHDLDLTRTVALQMAPQIRLLQNNDTLMAEKIQSSVVNTIPLWKSQMVLTLGLENSRSAIGMQTEVANITNELLKRNAKALQETSLAVARESERGILDVAALKETNGILIATLDEMLKIREEGRKHRLEAEGELRMLEREIRLRLLNRPQKNGT